MPTRTDYGLPTARVLVFAAVYSAIVLGAGLWVSIATGNWFALVLAIGLTAPVEVLLVSRHKRRTAARRHGAILAPRPASVVATEFETQADSGANSSN